MGRRTMETVWSEVVFLLVILAVWIAAAVHGDSGLSGTCYVLRTSEVGVPVKYMFRAYTERRCHDRCLGKVMCQATLLTTKRLNSYCQVWNSTFPSLTTTDIPTNITFATREDEQTVETRRGKQPQRTTVQSSGCECPHVIQDEIITSRNGRLMFYYQKSYPFGLYLYRSGQRSFVRIEGVSCAAMSNMHIYNCRLFYTETRGVVKSICVDGTKKTTIRRPAARRNSLELKYDEHLNAALVIDRTEMGHIQIIKLNQYRKEETLHTFKSIRYAYFELDTVSQHMYYNVGGMVYFVPYNSQIKKINTLEGLSDMPFSPSFDEQEHFIIGEHRGGYEILDVETLKRRSITFNDHTMDQYKELCYFRRNIFLFYDYKIRIVNLDGERLGTIASSSGKTKCIIV